MKISLDPHTHLVPVRHKDFTSFPGIEWRADTEKLSVDGKTIGMRQLFQPEALLDWMERSAIDHAWISPPPPLFRPHLDEAGAGAWARVLTDGLDEIASAHREKLTAVCYLPIEHPAEAARIALARIAAGKRLFTSSTGGGTLILSDARYDQLWQVLSESNALLFLHPGETPDRRLEPFYLANLVGNPHETAIAVAHLVFGGVLSRFPGIQILLSHGGGSVAALAGRWEQGFVTNRPGVDTTLPSPRALLKRVLADCIVHSVAGLRAASETFGVDNIVFGSDWPFPMGLLEPEEQLTRMNADKVLLSNTNSLRQAFED